MLPPQSALEWRHSATLLLQWPAYLSDPASFPPPRRPRRRRPDQAGCAPGSLPGISEPLHCGVSHPSLPLSNRDAAAVGSNRRLDLLITTSPGKPRGLFRWQYRVTSPELRIPMDPARCVTLSAAANRLRTSRGEGDTEADKMAAAAAQGGRAGGGGGSGGSGGGPSCGTGSSRSGLLDKVRNRFWGTGEAEGEASLFPHPRPPFLLRLLLSSSGPPREPYGCS